MNYPRRNNANDIQIIDHMREYDEKTISKETRKLEHLVIRSTVHQDVRGEDERTSLQKSSADQPESGQYFGTPTFIEYSRQQFRRVTDRLPGNVIQKGSERGNLFLRTTNDLGSGEQGKKIEGKDDNETSAILKVIQDLNDALRLADEEALKRLKKLSELIDEIKRRLEALKSLCPIKRPLVHF